MIEELSCENIFLGELKHGGVIEKKEHWEVDATNCAAIYATKVPQDLKNTEVVITDILGNEILRSNFIEVPQGKYQNSNLEEIAYIVKTPINKKSIGEFRGLFKIFVAELNYEFVINVENPYAEENNTVTDDFNESFYELNYHKKLEIDEVPVISLEETTLEEKERELEKIEFISEFDYELMTKLFGDDRKSEIDEVPLISLEETTSEEREVEEEKVEKVEVIKDKIKHIVLSFMGAPSVTIDLNDFIAENPILDGNIIIEKIRNRYYATIVGSDFGNFKMLDGDNNFFIYEDGPIAFLDKIRNRLKAMYYLMDDEKIRNLKVNMILDSEVEVVDDNESEEYEQLPGIKFFNREEIIKLINKKGINSVTISDKSVLLCYIDDNARKVEVKADLLGTLGARVFIEKLLNELDADVTIFDETCENENYTCLTDMLF